MIQETFFVWLLRSRLLQRLVQRLVHETAF